MTANDALRARYSTFRGTLRASLTNEEANILQVAPQNLTDAVAAHTKRPNRAFSGAIYIGWSYFTYVTRVSNRHVFRGAFAIRALTTEQKNPNIYYYLGRAGTLEGNAASDPEKRAFLFQVAMVAFEKGWALARQDDTFPIELASLYDALGRFSEAEWM